MDEPRISIVIPVGPEERHRHWLQQAIDSAAANHPYRMVIVWDGCAQETPIYAPASRHASYPLEFTGTAWNVGVGSAFNLGIAELNLHDYALMMGADDWLEPDAVAEAKAAILATPEAERDRTWYILPLRYEGGDHDGQTQVLPNNACVVSRRFWDWCGGFPPEATNTAPDHVLVSALNANGALKTRVIGDGRPLYHYRDHPESQTRGGYTNHAMVPILREWFEREWPKRKGAD